MPQSARTKRLLVYIPLFCLAAFVTWFITDSLRTYKAPSPKQRVAAFGEMSGLSDEDLNYYNALDISPLPEPGVHDWLYSMGRSDWAGQTVEQWKRSRRNPVTKDRRTIYLQVWSEDPEGLSKETQACADYLQRFYQLEVSVLPPKSLSTLRITSRSHNNVRQWLAPEILESLETILPDDAYCLLAMMDEDLYPDPDWNFVFGLASVIDRTGVFSLHRYGPSPLATAMTPKNAVRSAKRLRTRALKTMTHEVGHMFGLRHCIYYKCLMNGTSGLAETDRTPLEVCPVCLRKIQLATGLDLKKRHQDLMAFETE